MARHGRPPQGCPGAEHGGGQGSPPAPGAPPRLRAAQPRRGGGSRPGWQAEAACQGYFALESCCLGAAACGTAADTVGECGPNSCNSLLRRERQQQRTSERRGSRGGELTVPESPPARPLPAEPGHHMRPRAAPSRSRPPLPLSLPPSLRSAPLRPAALPSLPLRSAHFGRDRPPAAPLSAGASPGSPFPKESSGTCGGGFCSSRRG